MIVETGRKLLHIVAVLLIVSFGVTFLINLTPGDPAYSILGSQASAAQVRQIHETLHLDDPFYTRYVRWLNSLAHGSFGESFITHQSVTSMMFQALPVTAELIVVAMLLALLVSVPMGVYTAHYAGRWFDRVWTMISSALISAPSFVVALLLVDLFALRSRVFPVTGWVPLTADFGANLRSAALPEVTLALVLVPPYSRMLRADMIATLQHDFVLAAHARGTPTRVILWRHALRPSSFSLVTLVGLSLGQLISGTAIIEVLFALPGLGALTVNSVVSKDVPVVQGVVMFIAIIYALLNWVVDIGYTLLDPRVRLKSA